VAASTILGGEAPDEAYHFTKANGTNAEGSMCKAGRRAEPWRNDRPTARRV
jgi:hypothetical protein